MQVPQLLGVPPPVDFEAFSCWFSRLTLSQGSPMGEVARYLDIDLRRDIDRQAHGEMLGRVRLLCGLSTSAFAVQDQLMRSLEAIEPIGDGYLATAGDQKPRFRYCVACLSEMRIPCFPVHWRFIAWRRCPVHDCLLEDACHNCGRAVVLPASLERSTAGRAGHATLDRCLWCSERLTGVAPCLLQVGSTRLVKPWEDEQLANGRALLAALLAGSFKVEGRSATFRLASLKDVERRRAFPVRMDWLSPKMVKARLQSLRPDEQAVARVRADRTAIPFAKLTPARRRARCLVLAAGLIDEPLRDLWTVWSMTARGAAGAADVPLAAEGVEGMGRPPGCG